MSRIKGSGFLDNTTASHINNIAKMKFTSSSTTTSLAYLFALLTLSLAVPTDVYSAVEKRTTWLGGLTTDANYLVWCLRTSTP